MRPHNHELECQTMPLATLLLGGVFMVLAIVPAIGGFPTPRAFSGYFLAAAVFLMAYGLGFMWKFPVCVQSGRCRHD